MTGGRVPRFGHAPVSAEVDYLIRRRKSPVAGERSCVMWRLGGLRRHGSIIDAAGLVWLRGKDEG